MIVTTGLAAQLYYGVHKIPIRLFQPPSIYVSTAKKDSKLHMPHPFCGNFIQVQTKSSVKSFNPLI